MKLLALETATDACSAALLIDCEITSRFEVAPRRHTELILPMCEQLLSDAGFELAQLDAVAFGRGPGSFTGVRIATGVAQGIAFASQIPTVPVSTLAALAQRAIREGGKSHVVAALDARMGEVYWGCYERDDSGNARVHGEEHVTPPQDVWASREPAWYGVGSGWASYAAILAEKLQAGGYDGGALPHAQHVAELAAIAFRGGLAVPAEQAAPVYLRYRVTAGRE
ncbi:MAG: tRNA (adenosine(37)-N6)-threonylcarbamoyltransferase complex dimerization subunit type 1 TsaB [Gammaproteobacteria bacterium]